MREKWMKQIIIFLAGQTITLFGSTVVQFAISWHVTLTTQSGLLLALSTICGFLPQLLISPFAGVWADRFNRKIIIILSDGMIATVTLFMALYFATGNTNIILLFAVSAVRSVGTGIQMPATRALLPTMAPADKLMRINGLHSSLISIMMLLSPAVAGTLLQFTGMGPIFMVDVITALVGIAFMITLKIPRINQQEPSLHPHILSDMLSGLRYTGQTKWLKQLLIFYLFFALSVGPVVFLVPIMITHNFGNESWMLTLHEMVFSVGSIIGGLSIGLIAKRLGSGIRLLIVCCTSFGLTTLLLGFSPNYWLFLGIILPLGFFMPLIETTFTTIIQTHAAPELLGRVFGLVTIIGSSAMPLSTAIFGPLADYINMKVLLLFTGIIMVGLSLMITRFKAITSISSPKIG
ncbi:MAG: MFS transporter [Lachnospiraceae bacterium]|nr:MFS transporter [Lachnospiraceae bacterium]